MLISRSTSTRVIINELPKVWLPKWAIDFEFTDKECRLTGYYDGKNLYCWDNRVVGWDWVKNLNGVGYFANCMGGKDFLAEECLATELGKPPACGHKKKHKKKPLNYQIGDLPWLMHHGCQMFQFRIVDVILSSRIVWAGFPFRHSLDAISQRMGFAALSKELQAFNYAIDNLPRETFTYCAGDAKRTFEVAEAMQNKAQWKLQDELLWTENEAIWYFLRLNNDGLPINIDKLKIAKQKAEEVRKALFDKAKIWFAEHTSVREEDVITYIGSSKLLLATLRPLFPSLHNVSSTELYKATDIGKIIRQIRSLNKLIYAKDKVFEMSRDGKVFSAYSQIAFPPKKKAGDDDFEAGSGMGRSGSREPNMQNVPKARDDIAQEFSVELETIRDCAEPPPGMAMLLLDFAQCHAKIAAEQSQDTWILGAIRDGVDVHSELASAAFGGDPKEIKKKAKAGIVPEVHWRQMGKNGFYSAVNFASENSLHLTGLKAKDPINIPLDKCRAILKAFDVKAAKLREFQYSIARDGLYRQIENYRDQYGLKWCIIVNPNGGILHLRIERGARLYMPNVSSFLLLRTEATIVKRAGLWMIKRAPKEWGVEAWGMVHDELIFGCKEEYKEQAAQLALDCAKESYQREIKSIPFEYTEAKQLLVNRWSEK